MSHAFIRVYKKMELKEIKEHLLIYGDLSGQCANCQQMELPLETPQCPQCGAGFHFIAFRNLRNHMPKLLKLNETHPHITFIDHDDFKRLWGESKAKDIFG